MIKKISIAVIGISIILVQSIGYAHIEGAFGDFLLGVREGTDEELKREMQRTKEEIELLQPAVKKLEKEYEQKEVRARSTLMFYQTIGLDMYIDLILQSEKWIDILANQRIVEKNLEEFIAQLDQLYVNYKQLEVTLTALEGHRRLLSIIENNLQKREEFFQTYDSIQDNYTLLAAAIHYLWEYQADNVGDLLEQDSERLKENFDDWLSKDNENSHYQLKEVAINKYMNLDYHFRSDHIYAHYNNEKVNVILIGIIKNEDEWVNLEFEAGFINGIMIGEEVIKDLMGFEFNVKTLKKEAIDFEVKQENGSIIFQGT